MKIECDKCGAKYSIADEKVRGKTFKIRCKKCSNVIIVRDSAAAAGAAAGGADLAVDHAHPGWHLALNGETVGPMSDDDVRHRYDRGEIDKDTAIWQEGFEDWVPLGDVSAFADLPDRPAPSDDPFASANQDDYAAPGGADPGGYGGAAMAAGMGAPMAALHVAANEPAGSAPRVSSLTGQRNENSVLFSLDSLQALATGGTRVAAAPGGPGGARQGPKSLATAAPSSEGSGLIDIRALGAMVGQDSRAAGGLGGQPRPDEAALPTFGGAGFGGIASPLVPQLAPVDPNMGAATAAPVRSNAPIYAVIAVLFLAVVGLAAFIFLQDNDPVIVEKQVSPDVPKVNEASSDKDDNDKAVAGEQDEDEDKADHEDEGEDKADESDQADSRTAKKRTKSRSKSRSKSGSKSDADAGLPLPGKGSSASPSKSSGDDGIDVDCLLDPSKCGKKPKGKSKPSPTPVDPSLPSTLTQNDIRAGVDPLKNQAKACGPKHGAKPGEKVQVKISISGATGAVSASQALGSHKGTSLGNCVAAVLKKAKFKKFQKPVLGAVYPITM